MNNNKIRMVVEIDQQRKNRVEFTGKMQLLKHDHEVYVGEFDAEKFFCIPFSPASAYPAFSVITFSFYLRKRLIFAQCIFWNDLYRYLSPPTRQTICLGQLHTAFQYDSARKSTFEAFDESDFENKVFFTFTHDEPERRLRFNRFYCEFNKNNVYYLN